MTGIETNNPFLTLTGGVLLEAAAMVAVFVVALFVGSILVPGRRMVLTDAEGESRNFRLNGLALFLITAVAAGLAQFFGVFSLARLYTHFAALFVVVNILSLSVAAWLYWGGTRDPDAPKGFVQGFLMGRKLNPTCFGVDLKMFSYRPSLIGLALFNASFGVVQYETYGELTLAMTLYQAFTFLYVFNYFQFEDGMIFTWDIISERFGFNLVWGDYVLVPFFYCIAGWWLVHPAEAPLSPLAGAALVLLFVFGFWLFRGANQQKHDFKQNPDVKIWGKPAQTLDGRLLISGFWGIGRHLNYSGEICVYLAFTLTTGFASFFPYLLPLWLACLLSHRCRRDERRCHAKYGELWERYTKRVRFAMLPYVY